MSTRKHDFTKTEIVAGLLVTMAAVALAGFIAVVTGFQPPKPMNTYYAGFYKVIGLNPGADVRFGGVKAGFVSDIGPDPEDQSQIRVTMQVEEHIPVNAESVATIEQTTLTAEKHLEISTGAADAERLPTQKALKSVTLSGGFVEMPDLTGVISRVETILDDARTFLGVEQTVQAQKQGEGELVSISDLTASARGALDQGASILKDTSAILNREESKISQILSKVADIEDAALQLVRDISSVMEENRPALQQGLQDAAGIAKSGREAAEKVANELDALLEMLKSILDNGDKLTGTARKMLDQNQPAIEQTILDVQETVRHLRSFSRTMAEEPQAVIRGKRPVGR